MSSSKSSSSDLIGSRVVLNVHTTPSDQTEYWDDPAHGCPGVIVSVSESKWSSFFENRMCVTVRFDQYMGIPGRDMYMPISKGTHADEKDVPVGNICGADFV